MLYISFDIGIKNLAYCILNNNEDNLHIIDWNIITLAEKKNKLKGINNISDILFFELDNLVSKLEDIDFKFIDYVLIENQPSNLNGIMKTIQFLIFSYFDLLRHWDNKIGQVLLINPSLKLQNHTYIPASKTLTSSVSFVSRSDKYKLNKSDSIEICSKYIKSDDILLNFFISNKKKDDLSDTCLQAVSYMRKNGHDIKNIKLNEKHLFQNIVS